MDREILFKAIRRDNRELVFGSLIISTVASEKYYHVQEEGTVGFNYCFPVIPETIGQFINRLDKHGNKIFHKDRMKGVFLDKSTSKAKKKELEFTVDFDPMIGFFIDCENYGEFRFFPHMEDCEIIGNIHDNTTHQEN